jgi:hypothetical protein
MTLSSKTTLCGNSIIETLGGKPISSASNGRVNGGCLQRSLATFLLNTNIYLGCTELIETYGNTTFVELAEVQAVYLIRYYRLRMITVSILSSHKLIKNRSSIGEYSLSKIAGSRRDEG